MGDPLLRHSRNAPASHDAVDASDATTTDAQLLDATRCGSTEAFGELFVRYQHIAVKVARRAGVRPGDVDDVVADAWARVLRAIDGGKGPTENFPGYLATAIRRVSWAYNEHHSLQFATDDQATLDGVWIDEIPASLVDTDMGRALARLPRPWREVIWRVEVDREKVASIAAEQGKSANSVSAIASRARKRLRAELAALQGLDGPEAEVAELAQRTHRGQRVRVAELGELTA